MEFLRGAEGIAFFSDLMVPADKIVALTCYKMLCEIKRILEDDTFEDHECFMRIERIVCLFEKLESHCGNRHDFG